VSNDIEGKHAKKTTHVNPTHVNITVDVQISMVHPPVNVKIDLRVTNVNEIIVQIVLTMHYV